MEWGCIIIEMLLYCELFWSWNCIFYQNSIFWCNPWDVYMVLMLKQFLYFEMVWYVVMVWMHLMVNI